MPPGRSGADAATSARLDTIPARARAAGSGARDANNPVRADNPGLRPGATRRVPARAAVLSWQIPDTWLVVLLARIGDRMFAMSDAEADWRDWEIERSNSGLGRRYRDARFGRRVNTRPLTRLAR